MKVDRDTWDSLYDCTVLYVWVYPYTHTHTPEVLDVAKKDPKVAIYAPAHFKATWRKFLEICDREGVSASHLVRVWVAGYVARKDPGNPQPPLTAYIEGHEDEVAARRSDMVKSFIARAAKSDGTLSRREVLLEYKALGVEGNIRVELTRSMCEDLKKLGVKIRE